MRPVVGGKCEGPAGHDRRKSIRAFTEPGKALRERLAAESCEERAADEAAAGDRDRYRSLAKILIRLAGCMRASLMTGSADAASAAAIATPVSHSNCSGKT